jgi:peptide/nickel transport system ATP-binding protein
MPPPTRPDWGRTSSTPRPEPVEGRRPEPVEGPLSWQQDVTTDEVVLSVRNLSVEYPARRGAVKAVRSVDFDLYNGETLCLIGESGSGKTTLGLALVQLLAKTARVSSGSITYRRHGQEIDVLALNSEALRQFRWQDCAMVFQSALNSLNPVLQIWDQFYDTAKAHGMTDRNEVHERSLDLLERVQLEPRRVIDAYPHELSGGMRQRVLLAMSLLLDPQIIILDEPTTALDILTQRTIIDLLRKLKAELGFSMLFISHDLAMAAELADRVATMYAGKIIEIGPVRELFYRPQHPYTLGLIRAVPTVTGDFENLVSVPGSPPDLIDLPSGLERRQMHHFVACFHSDDVEREIERDPIRSAQTHEDGREQTATW